MGEGETAFSVFHKTSSIKDPCIQVLYDYEKHYMELIKKYKGEIEFVEQMLQNFRLEQTTFLSEVIPKISEKLNDESIDADMKKAWLDRLAANIDRSFSLSETLITDYTTKKLNEFKTAVNERLNII